MIKEILKEIWENVIPPMVKSGAISYERQLQAEFYHQLKHKLDDTFKIRIEPVIYLDKSELHKTKPDMILIKDGVISCIIEFKFKPYEEPAFAHDLKKLLAFEEEAKKFQPLTIDYQPNASGVPIRLEYKLNPNILYCYSVFGREGSYAFNLKEAKRPDNFLHLFGYVDVDGSIICIEKKHFSSFSS